MSSFTSFWTPLYSFTCSPSFILSFLPTVYPPPFYFFIPHPLPVLDLLPIVFLTPLHSFLFSSLSCCHSLYMHSSPLFIFSSISTPSLLLSHHLHLLSPVIPHLLYPLSSVSLVYIDDIDTSRDQFILPDLPLLPFPSPSPLHLSFVTACPSIKCAFLFKELSAPTLASVCWLPRQPPEPSYL